MKPASILCCLLISGSLLAQAQPGWCQVNDTSQVPKGKTTLLRASPKVFATFLGVTEDPRQVRVHVDGDAKPSTMTLDADAEVKVAGWWGQLDQIGIGDRIWAWSRLNRDGKPFRVIMLADEISEQAIHNLPYRFVSANVEDGTVTIQRSVGRQQEQQTRHLSLHESLKIKSVDDGFQFSGAAETADLTTLIQPGETVYVQTAGNQLRLILPEQQFAETHSAQQKRLRQVWSAQGLPGTVSFSHPLVGEVEVMLDHEAMRWGRYLQQGEKIKIAVPDPIDVVVHDVAPWHEKTRVTLSAVNGQDLTDLTNGQRVRLLVPAPPENVLDSPLPTDLGRARTRDQRLQWLLASTYCSCSIDGDGCTGMFYTLASCNPGTCGMPNRFRGIVGPLIDQGKDDHQILAELQKTLGPMCLKQHLLK